MKERVGLVFTGALIWTLLGELSKIVGYSTSDSREESDNHLNHTSGAPIRDCVSYLPIFVLKFGFLQAFDEKREEGSSFYQNQCLFRKMKRDKTPMFAQLQSIDDNDILLTVCPSKRHSAVKYIEDWRFPARELQVSISFMEEFPRCGVAILSAVLVSNYILKNEFNDSIENYVTFYKDGSIKINCKTLKNSKPLSFSANHRFVEFAATNMIQWETKIKSILKKANLMGDVTKLKYCVPMNETNNDNKIIDIIEIDTIGNEINNQNKAETDENEEMEDDIDVIESMSNSKIVIEASDDESEPPKRQKISKHGSLR